MKMADDEDGMGASSGASDAEATKDGSGRKLEAGILDSRGLIPNTPEWLEFWGDKLERLDAGEDVDFTGMTLAFVDAIIEAAEREQAAMAWHGSAEVDASGSPAGGWEMP